METNGEKILSAMNAFELNVSSGPEDGADELPFESLDDFSIAPLTFEETAVMIRERTEFFFDLTARYNRKSPKYLEACAFLEKGIRYLGSCCLTMEILKKNGRGEFPQLGDLSTHWLFGMVSFNVRKLDAAMKELIAASGELPGKWQDMQFRFLSLAERLQSTEKKIYDCCTHPELGNDILKRAQLFTKEAFNRSEVRRRIKPPSFRSGAALPFLKNAVREEKALAEAADPVQDPAAAPVPEKTDTISEPAVKEVTTKIEGSPWERTEREAKQDFYLSKTLGELNAMQARNPGSWDRMMDEMFGPNRKSSSLPFSLDMDDEKGIFGSAPPFI